MAEVGPPLVTPPAVFEFVGRTVRGATSWVWLRADLDMATVPGARAELDTFLAHGEAAQAQAFGRMLIHLGVEVFVDLHGLRLLIDVTAQVRTGGGELHLIDPPRCVRLMVRVLHLDDVLSLLDHAQLPPAWVRDSGRGADTTRPSPTAKPLHRLRALDTTGCSSGAFSWCSGPVPT
jgi:anti-anti-sigma regulatory factor